MKDPGVATVIAFTGGGGGTTTNTGRVFIALKPLAERKVSADQIITRLRPQLERRCTVERDIVPQAVVRKMCVSAGAKVPRSISSTITDDNLQEPQSLGTHPAQGHEGNSSIDGRQQRRPEQRPGGKPGH